MKGPKEKVELELDLGCAAGEYAYRSQDTDFECMARVKMTGRGPVDVTIIDAFTLTPKEADIALKLFIVAKKWGQFMYEADIRDGHAHDALLDLSLVKNAEELISRIEKWQNENKSSQPPF